MAQKTLQTLIRLARQHLDNQRLELLDTAEQLRRIDAQISFLKRRVEEEAHIPKHNPSYQHDFDCFRRHAQDRCNDLRQSRTVIEKRFETLQEKAVDTFKQKKSYEMALKLRILRQKKAQEINEQRTLDESVNRARSSSLFKTE